jgi:hypothetical protein
MAPEAKRIKPFRNGVEFAKIKIIDAAHQPKAIITNPVIAMFASCDCEKVMNKPAIIATAD